MSENPSKIFDFVSKRIRYIKHEEYQPLITTPVACLKSGLGSYLSRNILFVAIARSLGIPACLTNGKVSYFQDGKFHMTVEKKTGNLCLISDDEKILWQYNHNWSIAEKKKHVYETIDYADFSEWKDGVLSITLPEGEYRLITTNRLPNSNNCCKVSHFDIYENKNTTVTISLYEVPLSDMLDDLDIQDFILISDGVEYKKSSLLNRAGGMFVWLHPGEEPSEHILNEMYIHLENYLPYRESIHLIVDSGYQVNETLYKVANKLNLRVYTEKEPYNEQLARRVFCEPDVYPFIMMLNEKGNCLCAKHGYYVGNSGLMLKIFGRSS